MRRVSATVLVLLAGLLAVSAVSSGSEARIPKPQPGMQEIIVPRDKVMVEDLDMGEMSDLSALTLGSNCDKCAFATAQLKSMKNVKVAMHFGKDDRITLELSRDGLKPLSEQVCAGNADCVAFVEKAKSSPRYLSALFYGCSYTVWGDESPKMLGEVEKETVEAGRQLIKDTSKAYKLAVMKLASAAADVDTKKKECEKEHNSVGHRLLGAVGLGPCSEGSHYMSEVVGRRDQAQADLDQYRLYKKKEATNQFNKDFTGEEKYYMTTLRYNGLNACPTPLVCAALGETCDHYKGELPQHGVGKDRSHCTNPGECFGGRVNAVPEAFFNEFARVDVGKVKVETALPDPDQHKAIIPHATVGQVLELTEKRTAEEEADSTPVVPKHHSEKGQKGQKHPSNAPNLRAAKPHAAKHAAEPAVHGPVLQFSHGRLVNGPAADVAADTAVAAAPVVGADGGERRVIQFRDGKMVAGGSADVAPAAKEKKAQVQLDEAKEDSGLKVIQYKDGHRLGSGHHPRDDASPAPAPVNTSILKIGQMQCNNNGGKCEPGSWCCHQENYWYGQGIQCTPVGVCVQSCINPVDSRDNNGKCLYGAVAPEVTEAVNAIKDKAELVASKVVPAVKSVVQSAAAATAAVSGSDLGEKLKAGTLGAGSLGCNSGAGSCVDGAWCCYEDGFWFGPSQIPCVSSGVCVETCVTENDTRDNQGKCLHGAIKPATPPPAQRPTEQSSKHISATAVRSAVDASEASGASGDAASDDSGVVIAVVPSMGEKPEATKVAPKVVAAKVEVKQPEAKQPEAKQAASAKTESRLNAKPAAAALPTNDDKGASFGSDDSDLADLTGSSFLPESDLSEKTRGKAGHPSDSRQGGDDNVLGNLIG